MVTAVIGERVRVLYLKAATSDEAVRWLLRALDDGEREPARAWARALPSTHVARVLRASIEDDDARDLRETLLDLRAEAGARLRLLRVSATLASTLGLLGGILALAGGAKRAGLDALRAGGAERTTMAEALATMAIGVATSALCFQALALLRPAAQKLIVQSEQIARALGDADGLR